MWVALATKEAIEAAVLLAFINAEICSPLAYLVMNCLSNPMTFTFSIPSACFIATSAALSHHLYLSISERRVLYAATSLFAVWSKRSVL